MSGFLKQSGRCIRAAARFVAIELIGRMLYYSGVLFLIGFLRQQIGRRRLLVPMYHRVRGPKESRETALLDVQHGVPIDLFEQHVRVFRWFGLLLPLHEAFDQLRDPTKPSRSVIALTFDDGYCDNVTLAVPVLQRLQVQATFFPVVRTACGGRPLWWDELTDLLHRGSINGAGLAPYLANLDELVPTASDRPRLGPNASRTSMAQFLCQRLMELPGRRREELLETLATRLGVAANSANLSRLYADWEELRSVADAGIEIGGHTLDHSVLPCEPPESAQMQIVKSRVILEQHFGRPVRSFAYPNGRHDATVRTLTASAGYRLAVTIEHGVNYADTDPFQLRRMPIGRERPFHLAVKLAFYGWVNRR